MEYFAFQFSIFNFQFFIQNTNIKISFEIDKSIKQTIKMTREADCQPHTIRP